jgi:replicative DNA helicase
MSIIAERSILGGVLLDNAAYKQAAQHMKPKDFSLDSHRQISRPKTCFSLSNEMLS